MTVSDREPERHNTHTQARFVHVTVTVTLTDSFGVVPGPQQQLGSPVPEGHHHGVEVGQGLQGRVEESGETHVG